MRKTNETLDTLAGSVIRQAKKRTKILFVVWIITLALLIGTNAVWFYLFHF